MMKVRKCGPAGPGPSPVRECGITGPPIPGSVPSWRCTLRVHRMNTFALTHSRTFALCEAA